MTSDVVKRVIEGALLCAQRALTVADLRQLFDDEAPASTETVKSLLEELRLEWQGRSIELVELASGWRFQCAGDVARHVLRLQPERVPRYSRAVMETLAIVAYRGPVTRGDIEEIRGVSVSTNIIRTLEERGWIEQVGVKEVVGRPATFSTTRKFLDELNLKSLGDLPPLEGGAAADLIDVACQPAVAAVSVETSGAALPEPVEQEGGFDKSPGGSDGQGSCLQLEATTEESMAQDAATEPGMTETEPGMTELGTVVRPMAEQAMTKRATAERAVTEQAVTEQAVTEQAMTERAVTEQATVEDAMAEPGVTERRVAEKASAKALMTEAASESACGDADEPPPESLRAED